MALWLLLAFAFAMGMATSGLTASALSAALDVRAGFHPPFVRPQRLAVSLLITALAGPVMLLNDVVNALRAGRIGSTAAFAGLVIACLWALALGILVTELAWHAGILVT